MLQTTRTGPLIAWFSFLVRRSAQEIMTTTNTRACFWFRNARSIAVECKDHVTGMRHQIITSGFVAQQFKSCAVPFAMLTVACDCCKPRALRVGGMVLSMACHEKKCSNGSWTHFCPLGLRVLMHLLSWPNCGSFPPQTGLLCW